MIFPNNGKVVVFDDQYKDIANLLSALSKERIPFVYYQDEGGADLPDEPIENIRLVFLDLELVVNNPSPHNIISTIAGRFKKTLPKNSAYVLVYWSTKEDKYRETLEQAFENNLKDYKPILKLSLNKSEANSKENPVGFIVDALKKEIQAFSSLNSFMLWESCVNNAAGLITNSLTSIYARNADWDKNTYNLLYKLSKAQAGRDTIAALTNHEKLTTAFEIVNSTLIDTVEKKFKENSSTAEIKEIKEGGAPMSSEEIMKLNTKLHLTISSAFNHFYAGNLYIQNVNALCREIIVKNIKQSKIASLVDDKTKLVALDITPSCDYSQQKNYTRVLYGVKLDHSFTSKDLQDGDFKYKLCPVMDIDGPSYILFDFRYLKSLSRDELKFKFKDKPKYRLRNGLLLDIQAQFSNHINRPGFISVD
jgi:hypothetical protein